MSKRTVRFSSDIENNVEESKSQRLDEENSLDSDDDDQNANERKAKPVDNVLTEDDIEGLPSLTQLKAKLLQI